MVKAGDEGDGITAKVRLEVEGVLGVDEALTGLEGLLDESSTVFENEADFDGGSAQHVEELGGTRVVMGCSQPTRTDLRQR